MEEYVSLARIIKLFENYVSSDPRLHSFGFGDVIEFGFNLVDEYGNYAFMFVTPINSVFELNLTRYQFSIIFADRLNDDRSNRIQVISDMNLVARRFVSQIYINQGNLFDYMNIILPTESIPFMERFNFEVAGVVLNLQIEVFEDMNACDLYPTPTQTSTPTSTPSVTPTPTFSPTASCPVTTQYLEASLQSCNAFKLAVWNDAGFTSAANALCNYVISGTAYGDMGTVYSGTETILSGQHQHNFNLNPVLQPGECVSSFVVHSYSTPSCVCPVNLILP